MRKINPIQHDQSIISIGEIIDSKENGISKSELISIVPNIEGACDLYFEHRLGLENITENSSFTPQKDNLLGCYSSRTIARKKLCKSISSISHICPYCNYLNSDTLDHYLPKKRFPEYSFYGLNLIPCCHKCNEIKSDNWKTLENKRMFLNVYFDSIPCEQFLFVELKIEDDVLYGKFFIQKPLVEVISDYLWDILGNHVENFNLQKRYQTDFPDVITDDMINTIRFHGLTDNTQIKSYFLCEVDKYCHQFGNNHWKTVVYREIISNDDIIDYLKSK